MEEEVNEEFSLDAELCGLGFHQEEDKWSINDKENKLLNYSVADHSNEDMLNAGNWYQNEFFLALLPNLKVLFNTIIINL